MENQRVLTPFIVRSIFELCSPFILITEPELSEFAGWTFMSTVPEPNPQESGGCRVLEEDTTPLGCPGTVN